MEEVKEMQIVVARGNGKTSISQEDIEKLAGGLYILVEDLMKALNGFIEPLERLSETFKQELKEEKKQSYQPWKKENRYKKRYF